MADLEKNQIDMYSMATGNELALLECLLYLHDKGMIDKDELATRLGQAIKRAHALLPQDYYNVPLATIAMTRLKSALEGAKIDESGGQA